MAFWQLDNQTTSFDDITGQLSASRLSGRWSRISNQPAATDLFRAMTELTEFRQEFEITEEGILFLTASVDVVHRGISNGSTDNYPIGIATRIEVREASTQGGLSSDTPANAKFAYSAGNIASLTDHYGHMIFARVPFVVSPGWKRISLTMTAHTDAYDVDGTARLNGSTGSDYNYLLTEFEPGATVYNQTT